ncbi:hypothetical protein [Campylobacter devanensis]|uniref:hypothetical protein n=1 Tax=Campylobacter devanensis TaxID=3161138 RepID=UPI000A335C81|nr:hypothetical protein [Campylobacter sp. P0087]
MDKTKFEKLFSKERLSGYKDQKEHLNNFLLIQELTPKLGIIEIVTRNKVADILDIKDSVFISNQTFGYWAKPFLLRRLAKLVFATSPIGLTPH